MAKIVGKDDLATKRVTCDGCASIVEYVANEAEEVNGMDISGGPDGYRYVTCPGCATRIILERW